MARVRTDEKRQEIVRVASELFEQYGFDRTSMSMIADRLGGSKATLYGYFKSKEGLTKLGIAFLTRLLSATPIGNMRMLANQPEGSEMAKAFYKETLRPAWQRLADRMEMLMDDGLLRRADPWVATMQWKGLNEWDLLDRRLLGISKQIDPSEILKAATTAADAFLTLYGVEKAGKKKPKASPSVRN